jgi:hypothetical protein
MKGTKKLEETIKHWPNMLLAIYLMFLIWLGRGGSKEESSVRTVSQYIISLSTLTFSLHSIELEYRGDSITVNVPVVYMERDVMVLMSLQLLRWQQWEYRS